MKVVGADEMREIERTAVARGISIDGLIARAGEAVSTAAEVGTAGEVLILAGPGNNGSDGLFAARALRHRGRPVTVYTFHRSRGAEFEGTVIAAEQDDRLALLREALDRCGVVVDALLGIGQSRPPSGLLADILQTVRSSRRPGHAIAVDIPTGVNADTGAASEEAFQADLTLCMGFAKRGAVLYPGAAYAGRVEVVDVGIPEELAAGIRVFVPDAQDIAHRLPERRADSNKGTFGRLVFVGGSQNYAGAPALASGAAYRAGAGLVQVAVPAGIHGMVAAHIVEAIFLPLAEDRGQIDGDALPALEQAFEKAQAVVFGPGMGLSDQTVDVARRVLQALDRTGVKAALVDADGLNALATIPEWWRVKTPLVLTPHPGEMSRLTGRPIAEIQSDRLGIARRHATQWNTVVALKGAGTVVASPSGDAAINPTGGPNLAAAGTGDVLSGITGGLLAQGCAPFDAAMAGVYLHGAAGDLLRSEHGDSGTLAGDLLSAIPRARAHIIEEARENP